METTTQQPTDCLRIVLYGPESTGKTTLAKALAEHYQTDWVPEFARDFLQHKWDTQQEHCSLEDLITIAHGQLAAENAALKNASKFLFCDTNILVTKVWSETHFNGYCDPVIMDCSKKFNYDLYLLTGIDVPWVKDDLRDRPDNREEMFNFFKGQLDVNEIQYSVVSGGKEERLKRAILTLDKIFD